MKGTLLTINPRSFAAGNPVNPVNSVKIKFCDLCDLPVKFFKQKFARRAKFLTTDIADINGYRQRKRIFLTG